MKKYMIPAVLAVVTIIFTVLACVTDVAPAGVNNVEVGFSGINGTISEKIGYSDSWYGFSEVLGIVSLLPVAFFGCLGLYQLIKRKSLLKVDRDILSLGGIYIIMGILYILFDKVAINYRPYLEAGETEPEASFPSSHTLLAVVVLLTAAIYVLKHIEKAPVKYALASVLLVITVLTVVTRFLSGVHWFTDIIAGILYGLTLVSLYTKLKAE